MIEYTITVRVYRTNRNAFFFLGESSVYDSGKWKETNDTYVLKLNTTNSSGSLRFVSSGGEYCIATFGVDAQQSWCHVATDKVVTDNTGTKVLPQYYNNSALQKAHEQHKGSWTQSNVAGRSFTVSLLHSQANDYLGSITIG